MNSKCLLALLAIITASLMAMPQASALSVNLTMPDTGYSSAVRNITFGCNVTDENLTNITIYIWDSLNATYYTDTRSVTGTFNETNWTLNNTLPGDYTWNCMAYDNESTAGWAASNNTLHVNLFNLFESGADTDNTRSVALADLDNDGDLDYIAGNAGEPNRVYLNNGTGNFTLLESSAESDQTFFIAIADLDNDGDLDYIAGNSFGQPNRVYLNNGTGNFSLYETVSVTTGQNTQSIAIADLDNDGDLDFAEGLSSGTQDLRTYINNGTAHFTSGENKTSNNFYAVATGDLNGDGYADIVAGGVDPQGTMIYINNGSGYFTSSSQLWGATNFYTYTLSLGDLDNDGDLDIIEGNGNTGGNQPTRIFINNGTGNFTISQSIGDSDTHALLVGDFDNDGYLDILENNRQESSYMLINNGTGQFAVFETLHTTDTFFAAAGDLDDDGDLDYVTANFLGTVNNVYKNTIDSDNYVKFYVQGLGSGVSVSGVGTEIEVSNSTGDLIAYRQVTAADQSQDGTIQVHLGLASGITYTIEGRLTSGEVLSCSVQPPESFIVYENGSSTGGVSCTIVDLPPEVIFSYPEDGNVSIGRDINFSCNSTDDNMLSQVTIYVRNSTDDVYHQSTSYVTGLYNYTYSNLSGIVPDHYIWSCIACDNASQCTYLNSTFSILVDNMFFVKLVLNDSSSTIYFPGKGEKDADSSDYRESAPPHFFVSSQANNIIRGLVFSGDVPVILGSGPIGSDHFISLGQNLGRSRALLVFSSGGWMSIDDRIGSVESGHFFESVLPSFSFGLGNKHMVEIVLEYASIVLSGVMRAEKGTFNLIIENNGTQTGKPSVIIRKGY